RMRWGQRTLQRCLDSQWQCSDAPNSQWTLMTCKSATRSTRRFCKDCDDSVILEIKLSASGWPRAKGAWISNHPVWAMLLQATVLVGVDFGVECGGNQDGLGYWLATEVFEYGLDRLLANLVRILHRITPDFPFLDCLASLGLRVKPDHFYLA